VTAPLVVTTVVLRAPDGGTAMTVPTAGIEPSTYTRPGISWRRQVAQGSYNPGEVELSSVRDTAELPIAFVITGVNFAASESLFDALVVACCQGPGGLVDVTFNTTTRTWTATGNPSVIEQGERDGDVLRWSYRRVVTVTWPVHPYPS
jgi:hypothetical protein